MSFDSKYEGLAMSGLPYIPAAPYEFGTSGSLETTDTPLDEAFIIAIATAGVGDGQAQVESHHRNLWMSVNGRHIPELKCHRARFQERLEALREFMKEALEAFKKTPMIVQQPEWSSWDWAKFVFAVIGVFVLLAASVSTVFTLLRNTAVFEQMPVAAFVTAGLVACIPIAGKLVLDGIRSEAAAQPLRLMVGWAALGLFCVWAVLLARLTGGLGGGVQDPLALATTSQTDATPGGWPLSTHLQYLQMIVELLGSLACFIYADLLYQRYRPGKPVINSLYLMLFRRFLDAERALDADHKQLGAGRGHLRELRARREAFVGRARARYQAVLAKVIRRDQLRSEYSRVQSALDSVERELNGHRLNGRFETSLSN